MSNYTIEPRVARDLSLIGAHGYRTRQVSKSDFASNPELYVHLIREAAAAGDTKHVSAMLNVALAHLRQVVVRRYPGQYCMSQSLRMDAVNDIVGDACVGILSNDPANEFWGVRFWHTLHCRITAYTHVRNNRQNSRTFVDLADIKEDDEILAGSDVTPDVHAEIQDALNSLEPRERAIFLASNYLDMSQSEIAEKIKICERQVRNILRKAEQKIANWREGICSESTISNSRNPSKPQSRSTLTAELVRALNQGLDRVRR